MSAKIDIAHHHGRHVVNRRQARGRQWGYLEFNFKTPKLAGGFINLLMFGKGLGIVPESIELQYGGGGRVLIGHWMPK